MNKLKQILEDYVGDFAEIESYYTEERINHGINSRIITIFNLLW